MIQDAGCMIHDPGFRIWVINDNLLIKIEYPATSIQHLIHNHAIMRFPDIFTKKRKSKILGI